MTVVDPLYDIEAAAAYLGVRERHLKNLMYRRELAVVKIGRSVRLRQSELERYIAASTRPAGVAS